MADDPVITQVVWHRFTAVYCDGQLVYYGDLSLPNEVELLMVGLGYRCDKGPYMLWDRLPGEFDKNGETGVWSPPARLEQLMKQHSNYQLRIADDEIRTLENRLAQARKARDDASRGCLMKVPEGTENA